MIINNVIKIRENYRYQYLIVFKQYFSFSFQADMHTCAAKCYSDRKSPIESVERCANNCNAKLQEASVFVQREVESFQVKLKIL